MNSNTFRDISPTVNADAAVLTLPTRLELIDGTVEFLRHRAQLCGACDNDERGGRLVLALHEALTNAMVHGNLEIPSSLKEEPDNAFARALAERTHDARYAGRHVSVRFAYDGARCDFVITDEGPGFDTSKLPPPPAPDNDNDAADAVDDPAAAFDPAALEAMLKCSGRGITIMRAMVDELRYEQGGRQ
ncbi:MAG TPA: ATP-binding protein, partial [Tepidisphaeraceae bacterium]|nr:ATP-binding protein [Tepidisphaeraceae bacterium]